MQNCKKEKICATVFYKKGGKFTPLNDGFIQNG